ncbi:MAG TPA: hypothetical protein VFJ98_10490 [Mycobacteriales bacterium]|nr:hypothetical protein [Mycobacteriales bacterium]
MTAGVPSALLTAGQLTDAQLRVTNTQRSGETAMYLLNETLALERMTDRRQRAVREERQRQLAVARRVAAARRLQRRAESASRRARTLLASL